MADLALSPNRLAEYKRSPASVVDGTEGLTENEKVALELNAAGAITAVMRATQDDIAQGRKLTVEEIKAAAIPAGLACITIVVVVASV